MRKKELNFFHNKKGWLKKIKPGKNENPYQKNSNQPNHNLIRY